MADVQTVHDKQILPPEAEDGEEGHGRRGRTADKTDAQKPRGQY